MLVATPVIEEGLPQFVEGDLVQKDLPRWLWFAGDVLSARRKSDLSHLLAVGIKNFRVAAGGGDEIGSPCLLRTKGILPRAYFTPLEVAAQWMPADLIPDGSPTFRGVVDPSAVRWTTSLPGLKLFPGEAVVSILSTARNDQGLSRGIVEISSLRGLTPDEVEQAGFQKFFFADYPTLPPTLRGIDEAIRAAMKKTSDAGLTQMGEEMLAGCDEFRVWATDRIQAEENLVRVGTTSGGWTYRYSDVVEGLIAQLEYVRSDRTVAEVARLQSTMGKQIGEAIAAGGGANDQLAAVLAKLQENQAQLTELMTAALSGNKPAAPAPARK